MVKKIFIIAGEASGDNLGEKLMRELKKSSKEELVFFGVGGDKMESQGLKSLIPMHELSLLGFLEILPHAPNLLNRISQIAEDVQSIQPDILITIDAPAFNFRVVKKLQEYRENSDTKFVHYVAPTVWAYKPKRAQKVANLYDHLLLLLPFEPPYFEKEGLDCTFIGHPVLEDVKNNGDAKAFKEKFNIKNNNKILYIMAGSRKSEITRLLPIFIETAKKIQKKYPELHIVFAATKRFKIHIEQEARILRNVIVSDDKQEKLDGLSASTIALVKSGTGAVEVATSKVPMVIAYKVNPLSAWLLRRMIKVQYVNLLNLIKAKEIIPELLQENCVSETIYDKLIELIDNDDKCKTQIAEAQTALIEMGLNQKPSPSNKAADTVLSLINA